MDVLMPQLGETVAEGKITEWFKSVGDAVTPGDGLFEIETDKTSMEVPAIVGGTLTKICFQVGEVAKVGAVVAVIAGAGSASAGAAPAAAPAPTSTTAIASGPLAQPPQRNGTPAGQMDPWREVHSAERNYGPARLPGGIAVTPLARRLACECGIDLSRIGGSGPHGRIVAADVEQAAARAAFGPRATGASERQVKALFEGVAYEEVPLDAMRRTIAARLTEAKQTIPHFYLSADVEVGRLLGMREEVNAAAPRDKNGQPAFRLSLNDFIVKAWAMALQRVPAANAVWAGDCILRFVQSDIGVAVALDGGLITPVVRHAETKSLTAISVEMRDLAERGRSKKLAPGEYQGGASTISNLGMYGVREFAAIVNPPHATILAIGAGRREPVEAADGGVKFVDRMTVTLSCDHRVVDGALGAELLAAFRRLIEAPATMVA